MHQGFPPPQPYYAAPAQPRPTPRPVVYQPPQPRPRETRPATPTKSIAAIAQREPEAPIALKPVELPSPDQLGIRLDEPPVVLPAPEKLGIRLD
jgi:hypothetical protein